MHGRVNVFIKFFYENYFYILCHLLDRISHCLYNNISFNAIQIIYALISIPMLDGAKGIFTRWIFPFEKVHCISTAEIRGEFCCWFYFLCDGFWEEDESHSMGLIHILFSNAVSAPYLNTESNMKVHLRLYTTSINQ